MLSHEAPMELSHEAPLTNRDDVSVGALVSHAKSFSVSVEDSEFCHDIVISSAATFTPSFSPSFFEEMLELLEDGEFGRIIAIFSAETGETA